MTKLVILGILGESAYLVRHFAHGPVEGVADDVGNQYHRVCGGEFSDVEVWWTHEHRSPSSITVLHSDGLCTTFPVSSPEYHP